jgi:hypothetical protein
MRSWIEAAREPGLVGETLPDRDFRLSRFGLLGIVRRAASGLARRQVGSPVQYADYWMVEEKGRALSAGPRVALASWVRCRIFNATCCHRPELAG